MKPYSFFIQYKNKGYRITVNEQVHVEFMGNLSEEEYLELKKYLHLEGFLDSNTRYTII